MDQNEFNYIYCYFHQYKISLFSVGYHIISNSGIEIAVFNSLSTARIV